MERQESRPLGMILWRRKWIVVVTALLALGASIAVSLVRTPQYESSALLVRERQSVDIALFGTAIIQSEDVQRDLVTTAEALTSRRVAELVKESAGSSRSTGQLLEMVTAKPATSSNRITVKVAGPDPAETALLADEFAKQTILVKKEADKAAVSTARQALETQIALMTPADLESDEGKRLQTRVEQLMILEELQTGGYALWQTAQVPQNPVSPRPIRDAAAGLAVGIVLGLIFAVVSDRLDRRLKDHADFEREFGLPILALVPKTSRGRTRDYPNGNGSVGFALADPSYIESYRLLRSNLQYFEVEKGLRSILITSGLPQEAKTSTAINLSLSLAISGARVILVDTDLRSPSVHRYLQMDNSVGLSTLLAGDTAVSDALKVCKTSAFLPRQARIGLSDQPDDSALQKDFLCLTSGPLPPNPAELLASPRMEEVLRTLVTLGDYLLIDSAPVLLAADALSLATRVDGVIIVSRAGSATIDQAREVRSTLERVGARLVGLVISGVKTSRSYGYGRGQYPAG